MNNDQKHINWELLERIIAGQGDKTEQEAVQLWLDADSQNQDLYNRIQQAMGLAAVELKRVKKGNPHFDTEAAWLEMQAQIKTEPRIKALWQQTWAKAAAAILLIAAATFFIFQSPENPNTQQWTSVHNTNTGLQKLKLPDGSIVSLSADSKLEYTSSGRQTKLDGKAFFEVHKDALHPFTVQTDQVRVTVLGTQFQLESGDTARVQVLEGKVRFESADNQKLNTILTKGEEALFVPKNDLLERVEAEPNRMSWKTNVYVLREAKVSEVVQKLTSFYGVKVQLPKGVNLNGSMDLHLDKNDLKSAAEALAYFLKLEVQIKDKELIFK